MSLEMAHKVIVPQKKIMSRSFLNSGTLIVTSGTVLRSNWVVSYTWIWIGIRFVNKCLRTQHSCHFHHLSSPSVIIFEESNHLFKPWSEIRCFAFSKSFCLEFSPCFCINFAMRITVKEQKRVSCCIYVDFLFFWNHVYWTY